MFNASSTAIYCYWAPASVSDLSVSTYPRPYTGKRRLRHSGNEASAFTKRMVEGKLVRLEFDPLSIESGDDKDRSSRTLAYVFLQDGTHLNAEIIRQGYGFAVSSSPALKYQNEFRRLEIVGGISGDMALGVKRENTSPQRPFSVHEVRDSADPQAGRRRNRQHVLGRRHHRH
jgi:Staphylococcal nuclease homologue